MSVHASGARAPAQRVRALALAINRAIEPVELASSSARRQLNGGMELLNNGIRGTRLMHALTGRSHELPIYIIVYLHIIQVKNNH